MTSAARPRLALAFVLAVACQRAQDRAAERVIEEAIARNGREAHVEADRDRGTISIDLGAAVRPTAWPDEVPFYPHAERAKVDGRGRMSVTTEDSVADLAGFYRRELAAGGWELEPNGAAGRIRARRMGRELSAMLSRRKQGGSRAEIELGS